ncbi:sporulation membrane protein YtrI [Geomicrobium sp. JCM 19038]|uniref:sporulation membrane protein YtrI n=1 Tax=Geomicrobium sp. JCM 19038 TaxID=1460635 RepID=UPI00045F2F2C|nr:sporulation membrane protein YtrI [Geomicrobium sp. JCM 19038]GAK09687.1 hypothetical protein JCM19038_3539 [Geomicrobium sp. JCM 19038]
MRIPPYYKRPGWQRFLAGLFIGVVIGWGLFIFQYGQVYERTIIELRKNELTINQLESQIDLLLAREQEQEDLDEDQKRVEVETIEIHFTNERESRLSELALYDLRQQAVDELEPLLHQNLESVAEQQELVIRTLENKRFVVNEQQFSLEVTRAIFYKKIDLHTEIVIESSS